MNIVVIGSGNLALHLAPALKKNGHNVLGIYSRTRSHSLRLSKKLKSTSFNTIADIPTDADLYIVTIQDKEIGSLLKQITFQPNCIVHTSGSVSLSVFPKRFKNIGVFYPLQSFSIDRKVDFKNIPILIESRNTKTKKALSLVAKSISTNVKFISSEKRKKIHLAAVFANNFVNHLYSISSDILNENQLSFDLLKPLILETALKVQLNSPEKMQTGPARRNDKEIITSHLNLLKSSKKRKAIYSLLSESIIDKFK